MKETNREGIWQKIEDGIPFEIWVNPELNQLLVALAEILDGKKVMVLFRDDMPRDDDWQPIPLLPLTWLQVPGLVRKSRALFNWAKMASHLFRPVTTIWLRTGISSGRLGWIDWLMGYHLHHASQWVNVSNINIPDVAFPKLMTGFAFREWKVNVGRMIMEICKEIHLRGGVVLNYVEVEISGTEVILDDKISGARKMVIAHSIVEGQAVNRPEIEMGLSPWPGFLLRVPFQNDFLELNDREGQLKASMGKSNDPEVLADAIRELIGLTVKKTDWNKRLVNDIKLFNKPPSKKLHGFHLMVAPNAGGPPVEDVMETAFDISKQTGISFLEFRELFYRYGTAMDGMTEHAYQLMNQTRDHSIIWKEVTEKYREKFEWYIPKPFKP
ncbi:hypothetical protein BA6E_121141 [Bacteroidales bacterium 6E]|nr:hypothetical protein BA6E_121141 [Bacteroidales bacterium 6E]